MPGNPKARALVALIEQNGGYQSIFDAIADGSTIGPIAAKFGCSRGWFTTEVRKDPERAKLWDEAMRARADAMAEDALRIADDADADKPGGVQKAKLQAELRQWLAGVSNTKYRRQQAGQVQVNIGSLFLESLQHRITGPALPATPEALPVLEAVVEDEPEPENTQ